jgi:hypothetical protein
MARQFILVTMRGTTLDGQRTIVSTYLIRDVIPATEGSTIRCKSGYPDYPIRETIDELTPWLVNPDPPQNPEA